MGIGLRQLFVCASLFVLGLGLWAFWLEPASLSNEDHELTLPGWPNSCDGLRVAVLADLHVGSPFNGVDKLEQIVDLTLKAKPELILLAGDYTIHGVVGGNFVAPEIIAKGLSRLTAPLGVYAVLGNHDHREGARRVRTALESNGIKVLDDDSIPLKLAECRIWLAGLSDLWNGRRAYQAALALIPQDAPAIAIHA